MKFRVLQILRCYCRTSAFPLARPTSSSSSLFGEARYARRVCLPSHLATTLSPPPETQSEPALTDRQAQILRFIGNFIAEREMPPTAKEIAAGLGASTNTKSLQPFTLPLVKKGFLTVTPRIARGIKLTEKGKAWLTQRRREEEPLLS